MQNAVLQGAIAKVLAAGTASNFSLSVEFVSGTDSSYLYTPFRVDGIKYTQDSIKGYTDNIVLQVWMAAADYANMYDRMQDLHAIIVLAYHDAGGTRILKTPPLTQQFRAAIIDPKDIRKEMVDAHLRTEVDRVVKIRLVPEAIYTARSVPINVIYRQATVEDAIHHATASMGISSITMDPPDNIHVWDHINVPPMKKFSNFYSWIQREYGVYLCGMVQYYTNDHLYVYAPFNLLPTTSTTLTIYQAEKGSTGGTTCATVLDTNTVTVVTDTVHTVTDKTLYGAENVGTSVSFMRASEIQDGVVKYDPVNGAKFRDDVLLTIGLTTPKSLTSGQDRPRYGPTTDNVFALSSAMMEHQATVMVVEWTPSVPCVLRPGLAVTYYSDQNGAILKRQGILEVIDTMLLRIDRSSGGEAQSQEIYKSSTKLTVRLQPEGVLTSSISTT